MDILLADDERTIAVTLRDDLEAAGMENSLSLLELFLQLESVLDLQLKYQPL